MAEGKIRIKDVAKIAGVSATTVSNVIHGRTEKVSRKTRKRIKNPKRMNPQKSRIDSFRME